MDPTLNKYMGKKFAVVSHVLPPAPSGQSILLERLLSDMEPASYCLITSGKISAAGGLAGESHLLRKSLQIPALEISAISWFLLLLNTIWGIFDRARQITRIIRSENCDLLIGCTGDLYDLPATWLASRWTGIPFIAYIMDDYTFQWAGLRRRMAGWLETKFIHEASRVFVLNEFVRLRYVERHSVQPYVIHNPVRMPDLDKSEPTAKGSNSGRIDIVYTGSIYHAHYDAFLNLIEVLRDFSPDKVQLHIYTSQSREALEKQGIAGSSVVYHSYIPQDDIFTVLRQADILFLPLAFHSTINKVIQTSAPFKTSEYLAAGRPILVHAPSDSFLSWYFIENQCGLVVDQYDREILKAGLQQLISDEKLRASFGNAARARAEVDFSIETIVPRFISMLNDTVTGDM